MKFLPLVFLWSLLVQWGSFGQATAYPRVVNTATELRALPIPVTPPSVTSTSLMIGVSTPGDGNGGFLWWDYANTNADDNLNYFTNSGSSSARYATNGRWSRIPIVCFTEGTLAATPTFVPIAGSYSGNQEITILTTTPDASIFFTLDGATPDESSTLFTAPFIITENLTVRAIATAVGYQNSGVGVATYVIEPQVTATPAFSPVAGTYAVSQSVVITSSTADAMIFYTTDGSTPTSGSTLYTAPVSVAVTTTLKAIAIKAGLSDSAIRTGLYTITPVVAAPVFEFSETSPQQYLWSDDPGFPLIVTFTLTTATPGASIYWVSGVDTENDPDDSDPLWTGGPGAFTSSTQFKAIAKLGSTYSAVTTAFFAIELPVLHGYSPLEDLTGPDVRALQTEQLLFFWDETIPVFTYFPPHGTYVFDAGSTVNDYFYWAWPEPMPSPALVNGFYLNPFPVSMAGDAEGYTEVENGWHYQIVEPDTGTQYRVYRSRQQIGGGGTTSIVVQ